jgi:hypothetical protein
MTLNEVKLTLQRGPDDPEENSPEFQEELKALTKSLRSAGVEFSTSRKHLASLGATDYQAAAFMITVLNPIVIRELVRVFGDCIKARYARKLRIKTADVEVEGGSVAEIESLLNQVANFRDTDHTKSGET